MAHGGNYHVSFYFRFGCAKVVSAIKKNILNRNNSVSSLKRSLQSFGIKQISARLKVCAILFIVFDLL